MRVKFVFFDYGIFIGPKAVKKPFVDEEKNLNATSVLVQWNDLPNKDVHGNRRDWTLAYIPERYIFTILSRHQPDDVKEGTSIFQWMRICKLTGMNFFSVRHTFDVTLKLCYIFCSLFTFFMDVKIVNHCTKNEVFH